MGFFLGSRSEETFLHYLAQEEGTAPAYHYLSRGSAVVVPGPIPLRGDRYEWLRAPTRRPMANPLRPVALATMLVASAELLARVDRYGERYQSADTFGFSAIEGAPIDAAG
ncbi:hypothetical protein ACWDE0_09175 [Streptomyces sp. 900105755]